MNIFASKLIASCLTLLLALPSGWCCADFLVGPILVGRAEAAAPATSCCEHFKSLVQSDGANDGQRAPKCPRSVCCGHTDGLIETSTVDLTPRVDMATYVWSHHEDATGLYAAITLTPHLLGAGPRLHLLQCVWRI